ncbi:MAG: YceI family protein [Campylobacterota bacterium]
MIKKIYTAFIAAAMMALSAPAAQLMIDDSHSKVGFEVTHMMISSVDGRFVDYGGDIAIDLDSKEITALDATVNAKSIDTGIEKRDNHLRSEDFFYVKKHPEITFAMKKFIQDGDEGEVIGDLTIRGVTKEVILDSEITGVIVVEGTTRVGLELEGEINRKEFGLNWNKVIEAGGIAVGEDVKLEINLQLMKM